MNSYPFKNKLLFIAVLVSILLCLNSNLLAQEPAPYNRFQYQKLHWRAYHSKKFSLYFPANAADSLYRYVVTEMPEALEAIRKATMKEVPANLNIVIYIEPDLSRLHLHSIVLLPLHPSAIF